MKPGLAPALRVVYTAGFEDAFRKIRDANLKDRIRKQIEKLLERPEAGKPLRWAHRGERRLRIGTYRLLYAYDPHGQVLTLLDLGPRENIYRQ